MLYLFNAKSKVFNKPCKYKKHLIGSSTLCFLRFYFSSKQILKKYSYFLLKFNIFDGRLAKNEMVI
jgi:hypothetical protein